MPHIISFVKPQPIDELTGKAIEPAINYRNQDIQQLYVFQGRGQNGPEVEVPSPYQSSASCEEGSAFEVNKEVVSIQDHNRFNPGPFQEGSAIFPGHGVIAEDHDTGSFACSDPNNGDDFSSHGTDRSIKGVQVVYFEDIGSGDQDNNDVLIGVRDNIGSTAGPGSSTFMTAKIGGKSGPGGTTFMTANLGGNAGPGGSTFMTETFEPAAGMDSFGESLNPVAELGANSGPGGTSFMTEQFEMPTNNLGGSASPGGDDI